MYKNQAILFRYDNLDGLIINDTLEDDNQRQLLQTELVQFFKIHNDYLSEKGLIFSAILDAYFYVFQLDKTTYLLSSHSIVSSISFYFNRLKIDASLKKFTNLILPTYEDTKSVEQQLMNWTKEFQKYTPEILLNSYGEDYYEELIEFLFDTFKNNLPDLFYAIILQIPVFIISDESQWYDNFIELSNIVLPFLRVTNTYNPENHNHITIVTQLPKLELSQYLIIDQINGVSTRQFLDSDLSLIQEILDKSVMYHEEYIMPFHISMYSSLFWNIQKIYGVLALSRGKVDFSNYLYDDKIRYKGLLDKLYREIALLKEYIV